VLDVTLFSAVGSGLASGIVVLGIGSALWGLLAGALVMAWLGWARPTRATGPDASASSRLGP